MMQYAGALSFSDPLRKATSIMNKYSRTFPPHFAMSSPAAIADPPIMYAVSSYEEEGRGGETDRLRLGRRLRLRSVPV